MKYGRYEILRELGRGSMGVVYEAHDPQIDRIVALKVLRQDRHASDAFVRRFLKEARAIGRLSHPNIVTVHDVGEDQGTIYIAMEFLEGRPLHQVIEEKSFDVEEVLNLGIQIAETLDYAHSKGVVHRDIKPSNILVQPKGRIKITDFGIAHIEDPSATLQTQDGEILGTPAYMSPEQVLGKPVDGRSDLFSLGVILYELSTGTRPFGRQGKTLATLFNEITNTSPPEPVELNKALDPGLSKVIMKCLAKDPAQRYPTGEALAEALRDCRGTETVVVPVQTVPPPVTVPSKPSRLRIPLLVFMVLVASAAGFALFYPGARDKIASWSAKPRPAATATLKAESRPEGAEVWIDGTYRGKTPLEVELPLGEHSMRAAALGYEEWTHTVQLTETGVRPLKIELRPKVALAFLKIQSTPAGALLSIDGVAEGRTPLGLELPLGEHRVALTLEGHEEWSRNIQLSEEREYSMLAELRPVDAVRPATLKVETDPPGADILVDGELKGRGPMEVSLPTGRYRVAARMEGYRESSQEVPLDKPGPYALRLTLPRLVKEGTLRLASTPAGARIFLNGESRGITPLELKIPPGEHMLKLSLENHQEWEERIRIAEGRDYPVNVTLKPIVRESVLSLTSVPSNASVFIDGTAKGKTPLRLKLPPGSYKVQLKLSRYRDWESSVQLIADEEYPLKVTLTRLQTEPRPSTTPQEPSRRSPSTPTRSPERPASDDWGIGTYRDRRVNE